MNKKLIALIDGSVYSKSVCDYAAWIAKRAQFRVELIHVLGRRDVPISDLSGSIALGARSALLAELSELDEQRAKLSQQRGRAILEDAQSALSDGGVTESAARLLTGDMVETLADVEADAELVVIGKRGEAADFAKLHLGSNLERVVRASTKPVFVAARAFMPVSRVLVAFDGGLSSVKAVDYIASSPMFSGLPIHLLTVGNESSDARGRLDAAKAKLAAAGLEASADIQPGQAEKVISETVETQKFDLLVMGAYGHSRIRSLIIGSTTTEMIRSCKVPVLLFR